jgi:hypothetical protein
MPYFNKMHLDSSGFSDNKVYEALEAAASYPQETSISKSVKRARVQYVQEELDLAGVDYNDVELTALHTSLNKNLKFFLDSLDKHKQEFNLSRYRGILITANHLHELVAIRLSSNTNQRWIQFDLAAYHHGLHGLGKSQERICVIL